MVKTFRDLAIILSNNGSIDCSMVSKALNKRIDLWITRKEIKIVNDKYVGMF